VIWVLKSNSPLLILIDDSNTVNINLRIIWHIFTNIISITDQGIGLLPKKKREQKFSKSRKSKMRFQI